MASKASSKDKQMASYLKERGVTRDSGACPWGCGRLVSNGGGALLSHLGQCRGGKKQVKA